MAYDWIQLFPAHSPPARFQHMLSWDGSGVVLFGGRNGGLHGDTWTWNGTDWTQRFPAHSPSNRDLSGIAYDRVNDQVVLFGGNTDSGGATSGANAETWIWDRSDWTHLTPAHSPAPRSFAVMAYDETRSKVVLYGGADAATGALLDETWVWDGADWTQEMPTSSPGNTLGAMAWDATNGKVVHWGGYVTTGTWTWDGTDWTHESPAHEPPGPELPGLADWRIGGRVISFGGRTAGLPDLSTRETWTWNGTDWTQALPAHVPLQRADFMLAYDFTREQVVLFGGLGDDSFNDTWVYADTRAFTLHLETPD
jgi:hypothetical protein